ncbi:ARPP-1 family domain-containing protein [Poriferisphaera sp. WC338]|uniref:ARPP-1 family domain-containing protein n=1 Tax=Poriferisphaera sp. WC338 TaxID=3425129 RepID=UPI003D818807
MTQQHVWLKMLLLFTLTLCAGILIGFSEIPATQPRTASKQVVYNAKAVLEQITLQEPMRHENLTLYMLSAPDEMDTSDVITLEHAMEIGKLKVIETSNVNKLAVVNESDKTVFIHAGDIVRGGKQDRTLAHDMLIPPKSDPIPVDSFCVESGRWAQREGESTSYFSRSKNMLNDNDAILNARLRKSQQGVWRSVKNVQSRVGAALETDVQAPASLSSLQLTLENQELNDAAKLYANALRAAATRYPDTRGFIACINGEVYVAHLYASHKLLIDIWHKQLNALAAEAISQSANKKEFEQAKPEAALVFIEQFDGIKGNAEIIDKAMTLHQYHTKTAVLLESITQDTNACLHASFLLKPKHFDKAAHEPPQQMMIQRRNATIPTPSPQSHSEQSPQQ